MLSALLLYTVAIGIVAATAVAATLAYRSSARWWSTTLEAAPPDARTASRTNTASRSNTDSGAGRLFEQERVESGPSLRDP